MKKRSRSSVIGTSKETQTGSNEPTAIMAHTSQGHSSGKQAVRRGAKHSSSKTSKSKSGKTLTSLSDKTPRGAMHQCSDTDSDSDTSMPLATPIRAQKKSKAPKGVQLNQSHHIQTLPIPSTSGQNSQAERHIGTTARTHAREVQHMDEFVEEDQSSESTSDSESDLDHVGNSFAQNIVGNKPFSGMGASTLNVPMQYAEPISTPISSQISSKIKKQIWKNNFIDLGVLLPQMASQERQSFSLEIGPNSDFNIVPKSKPKKKLSIDTWTSAFLRFIAIYTEKFPLEIQPLLKYCEIIRDLAQRKIGMSWSVYDQQFRQLRQNQLIPWDRIHTEFWIKAAITPSMPYPDSFRQQNKLFRPQSNFQSNSRSTQARFLDNTCWKYNKRGFCGLSSCTFQHKCGYCRGSHNAMQCNQYNGHGKQYKSITTNTFGNTNTNQHNAPGNATGKFISKSSATAKAN